jgi:hypothetical protein
MKRITRKTVAFHETGHAVIALATGYPVALVTIKPRGSSAGHISHDYCPNNIGGVYKFDKRERRHVLINSKSFDLDAFGNPVLIRRTAKKNEAAILNAIAGPMAEAELLNGDGTQWRSLASGSGDMRNMRYARRNLARPKSWPKYEQQALTLVRKFWPMIEAVAARLLKDETLSGGDVDSICQRVRRQQLKNEARQ